MASKGKSNGADRVAIISGLRTPFLKQGTGFKSMTTLELSAAVVNELIHRTGVDPREYTACVFGQVMPSLDYINLAREIVMRTELVDNVTVAHSVTQACVTSIQALTTAINSIQAGEHDTMIVGGADSMDDLPLGVGRKLTKALMGLQKAKTTMDRVRLLSTISPKDLVPPMPGYSVEPSTGMSMGQHCETMVKDWGISREWQDKIAHESHTRAAKAWEDGFYDDLVMPVAAAPYKDAFREDNIVRHDSKLEDYAKLRAVYDKKHGDDHRGERIAPDGWGGGSCGDEGVEGQGVGTRADGLPAFLGLYRSGSDVAAAHRTDLRHPEGTGPCGPDDEGHRSGGDARGLCGAGRLHARGTSLQEVLRGALGLERADRRARSRPVQRQWWLGGNRPPLRCDRSPYRGAGAQGAEA